MSEKMKIVHAYKISRYASRKTRHRDRNYVTHSCRLGANKSLVCHGNAVLALQRMLEISDGARLAKACHCAQSNPDNECLEGLNV